MRDYEVTINFGGFIGCETTYTVFAENEDEAIKEAMELAMDDCSVESVEVVE